MSYYFDGVDDKIQFSAAQWADGDSDWSQSVWVYYDRSDNNEGYISGRWVSNNGWFLRLNGQPSEGIYFGIQNGSGSNTLTVGNPPDVVWFNLIITYTAATNTLEGFIGNTSAGTLVTASGLAPASTDFVIGNRADNARDFKGYIAEVAAWNKILSSAERADLQTKTPDNIGATPDFYVGLASNGDVGSGTVTGAVYDASHPTLTGPSGSTVSSDSTLQWNMLQGVHQDTSQQWDILNSVQSSSTIQWGILNAVQSDSSLQWSILSAVSNDAELRWGVIQSVLNDSTLQWNIQAALSAVSNDLAAQWDILQGVFAYSEARWTILNSVLSDSDLRWNILNSVLQDASLRWGLLNAVAQDATLQWDISSALSSVTSDVDLRWSIYAAVQQSMQAQWDILNGVASDSDVRWNILNSVASQIESRWDILQALSSDSTVQWSILGHVENDINLQWRIESDSSFPDITGVITVNTKTKQITLQSLTPIITIH